MRVHLITRPFALLALVTGVLLTACAPATAPGGQAEPKAVLINAPLAGTVPGLADHLEAAMQTEANCCDFTFQFAMPVRFQETHRDMIAGRAPDSAAALTRNLGGTWAVMVAAGTLERDVIDLGDRLVIHASVSVRVLVLDDQANELGRIDSPVLTGRRTQPAAAELPDPPLDPLVRELAFEAAGLVAGDVTAMLNSMAVSADAASD